MKALGWMSCGHICLQSSPIAFYQTGDNGLRGKIPTVIGNLGSLIDLALGEY